ncbi:MAG: sulfate transporter CysZ [Gammaproteobacteria bacterium]
MSVTRGGFLAGLAHIWRSFALLRAPGVRVYVLVPLLINVGVFVLALGSLGEAVDYTIARYLGNLPEFVRWLAWVLFAILAAIVVFFSFSVVANLVASPFNGLLAQAVERHLRGQAEALPFDLATLFGELARTLWAELRKLLYMALWGVPLVLFSLIPVLNAVAPALWLLFGAWMLCMEYLDCPLGNHGRVFPQVLRTMRARRPLALGFGLGMTAVTLVPVLNFVAVPLGVAAATRLYCIDLAPDDGR